MTYQYHNAITYLQHGLYALVDSSVGIKWYSDHQILSEDIQSPKKVKNHLSDDTSKAPCVFESSSSNNMDLKSTFKLRIGDGVQNLR